MEVDVDGKIYRYFMTNDSNALGCKLKELNCLQPKAGDWKANYALHKNVIDKMDELGALWSLTTSHNESILTRLPNIFLKSESSRHLSSPGLLWTQ